LPNQASGYFKDCIDGGYADVLLQVALAVGQVKFQTTCPTGQAKKNTFVEPYTSQAISSGFEKAVARSGKWIFLRLY
jgi:hypothetical protein